MRILAFAAFAAAAIAAADAAQATSWNPREPACREQLQRSVGLCAQDAQRTAAYGDFSYWQRCRARYQPEYERCLARAPAPDQPPPGCEAARINIDWVLTGDRGARATYDRARGSRSPLDAVIYAQGHNPGAQATIRRCAGWASGYVSMLERSGRRPGASPPPRGRPGRPADRRDDPHPEACVTVGPPANNYAVMERLYKAPPSLWQLRVPIAVGACREPIEVHLCLRIAGQRPISLVRTYGAGFTGDNPVSIPISHARLEDVSLDPPLKCARRKGCRLACH